MGKLREKIRQRQSGQNTIRSQKMQRAHGIGALPAPGRTPLLRQRFRKDEEAVECVGKAQACGHPEWQPWIGIAKQAAERRTENEACAEGDADVAEHGCALLWRRDVG